MVYRHIKDLREDSRLTQEQLGEKLGVAQNTYSQYETGKIEWTADVLNKLADLYQVSVDYLMDRTDVRTPPPKCKIKL